jgi:beta-lactamase superfamily II metal-dependent hydrolase
LALLSCTSGNRALPAQATLDRLAERAIPVYRTDETGDIVLTVNEGKLMLATYQARAGN